MISNLKDNKTQVLDQDISKNVGFVVEKVVENHFSEETIKSLSSLGETLKKIRTRLISNGYVVEKGRIYKKL